MEMQKGAGKSIKRRLKTSARPLATENRPRNGDLPWGSPDAELWVKLLATLPLFSNAAASTTAPLLTSLALLPPDPAEAQTRVSASNITETAGAMIDFSSGDSAANAFTTGGTSTDRYSLNSVIVNYNSGFPPGQEYGQHTLSIHAANGSNSGAQIGNLNGIIPTGGGFTTYTASGITLNGGTRYFVQVNAPVAPDGAHQPAPDFGGDRFGDLRLGPRLDRHGPGLGR